MATTTKAKDAPTVQEAKASPGVNAGTDEAGSLATVEDAQGGDPTDEPAAAFSSGFTADSVAREQRAIAEEQRKLDAVNAKREEAAKDEESVAATYKARIEMLERNYDALRDYIVKKGEGRLAAGDLDKLKDGE